MKKENLLSKSAMKHVKGGGLPPETPGGDAGYCASRGQQGYVVCIDNSGGGAGKDWFYVCCSSLEQAGAFCGPGFIYTCVMPGVV